MIHTVKELLAYMTEPSPRLIEDMKKIKGDIMIIGAGGKVGPTMAIKAQRAVEAAGTDSKIIAVSLFDYPDAASSMREAGVTVIEADISDPAQLAELPEAPNIIYMVGKKFGTTGNETATWRINVILPYLIAQRFPNSRIVSFSTGNVYGPAPIASGGSLETDICEPVGEYAQTCLGRERILTDCSVANNTPMLMFRLNYAIEMRYGVLYDIGKAVYEGKPIDLSSGLFTCVWQGEVCEYAIRSLLHTAVPPEILNVSSTESISLRWAAKEMGKRLGKEPIFVGEDPKASMFVNTQKMVQLMGPPQVGLLDMMDMVAQWILDGGEVITAPTHFESIDGKF